MSYLASLRIRLLRLPLLATNQPTNRKYFVLSLPAFRSSVRFTLPPSFRLHQFFDLHDMFVRWVNLPQCKDKQLDYSQFLQALGRFQDIPEQEKVRSEYICAQLERSAAALVLLLSWLRELDGVVVLSSTKKNLATTKRCCS